MNNQELFLAAIFGQSDMICYPYIWLEKDGEGEGEKEIWIDGTRHAVQRLDLGKEIQEVLDTLGEKPKEVLNLRFGLEDGKRRTYREIGREYGVTGVRIGKTRIGQIIQKSLYRLRHPSRSRRLKDFVVPSPEERFKEKQRFLNLEAELEKKESKTETLSREAAVSRREDENRLDVVLRKASADYQQRHGLTVSPYNHIHNALRRKDVLQLSELKKLRENDIRSLRGIGRQSWEVIKEALQLAEKEASP